MTGTHDPSDHSQEPFVCAEITHLCHDLKARGLIAVDTPALRAHLQQQLFAALIEEARDAAREEFLTTEELEELEELATAREDEELDRRLRVQLPLFQELLPVILVRIEDTLVNR